MNRILLLTLIFTAFFTFASQIMWQKDAVHEVDIDCDGIEDLVYMGKIDNDFVIKVSPSSSSIESRLQFGLGQASRQDAICGLNPKFESYASDAETQKMLFDEVFEGYKSGKQCFDLNISGGECDSITVFYNHNSKQLNWWRL